MENKIGLFFFKSRSLTPVPFLLFVLLFSHPTPFTIFLGLWVAALGEGVRIWGVGFAGSVTRTRNVGASSLVTNGPFAHVRNPLYVGNFLLSLGVCLAFNALMPWTLVGYVILFSVQYYYIVALEEATLEKNFGDVYRRYKASVPRFFPQLRPYAENSTHTFDLKKSLQSESRTLTALLFLMGLTLLLMKTGASPLQWITSLLSG